MNEEKSIDVISSEELKALLHPKESSRFLIALVISFPVALGALGLVSASMGILLIVVAIILFIVWFSLQLLKASLVGGSVRVSNDNFPEIYGILKEVKRRLNYSKNIDIYIIEGLSLNAFLYKFFQTKFIMLNSDMVDGMPPDQCRAELVWIIGRFVGALKAKHLRLQFLSIIINSIEKIKIFNLLILPYERATQYSGDQIGMALCKDLSSAITAFDKLLIGKDLAKDVHLKGLLVQANELHFSFFGWLSKILSTHPHLTDRYLNLLAFARFRYSEEFQHYVEQFDNTTISEIGTLLPRYYPMQPIDQA